MNHITDQQLLRDYAERQSEAAFAELVLRHIGLVHSASMRMVCDADLARDITQGTFVALAQNVRKLRDRPVLSGWLHRTAQNLAAKAVRSDVRRRAREQEAALMTKLHSTEPDPVWENIAPHLDAALGELSDLDRDALLLRYFEGKSAREMAQTFGISDEAAQKRVSRAVERLREFFAKQGITVAASGLAIIIPANAVQAAPVGLAVSVTTAATVAASAAHTSTFIAMTLLQKTAVIATATLVAGAGIYETRQNLELRKQNQAFEQKELPMATQLQGLQHEHDETTRQLTALREENERLKNAAKEMSRTQQSIRKDSDLPPVAVEKSNDATPPDVAAGRELGATVVRGDPLAFDKILALSKAEHESFKTNRVGLDQMQEADLARQTFAPLRAVFDVLGETGAKGNRFALDTLARSLPVPELNGMAVQSLGVLAGNGDEGALEVLLHPAQYGVLLSGSIGALKPAADNGNQKAIDALIAVTMDETNRALWFLAADGLNKAAGEGNETAIDALVRLLASPNESVQKTAVAGLKLAAAGQNSKATEALRSIGIQQ